MCQVNMERNMSNNTDVPSYALCVFASGVAMLMKAKFLFTKRFYCHELFKTCVNKQNSKEIHMHPHSLFSKSCLIYLIK